MMSLASSNVPSFPLPYPVSVNLGIDPLVPFLLRSFLAGSSFGLDTVFYYVLHWGNGVQGYTP